MRNEERERRLGALNAHLPAVEAWALRAIGALVRSGQLAQGALEAADVVDTVVVRALRHAEQLPVSDVLRDWLVALAARVVREEVGRERGEQRRFVPLDEQLGELPDGEALPSYRGWEYVSFERILGSLDLASPDQELASSELEHALIAALAALPLRWHEAFALRAAEEFPLEAAASALHREEADVERDLTLARAFLREKLLEQGALEGAAI